MKCVNEDCGKMFTDSFELEPVIIENEDGEHEELMLCKFCRPGSERWARENPGYQYQNGGALAKPSVAGESTVTIVQHQIGQIQPIVRKKSKKKIENVVDIKSNKGRCRMKKDDVA